MPWATLDTPIGPLTLTATARGLSAIHFANEDVAFAAADRDEAMLAKPLAQLAEYFAGTRRTFELALDHGGTPFQRRVWQTVMAVPYGETATYRDIATALGNPNLSRAVGTCNGRTPIPIVMPCHRVVGRDGRLTGYRGGLGRKRTLLELELALADEMPNQQRLVVEHLVGPGDRKVARHVPTRGVVAPIASGA